MAMRSDLLTPSPTGADFQVQSPSNKLSITFPCVISALISSMVHFLNFRVMLVDPARDARSDQFRIRGGGGPAGLMLILGIDKGHLLGAGNALVSVGSVESFDEDVANAQSKTASNTGMKEGEKGEKR